MQLHRISKGEMPPEGKYILIYVPNSPWIDCGDPKGVFWKVAKMVKDINYPITNNTKPYRFEEFGPGSFNGHEVDIWCELPYVNLDEPEIEVDEERVNKTINIWKKALTGDVDIEKPLAMDRMFGDDEYE